MQTELPSEFLANQKNLMMCTTQTAIECEFALLKCMRQVMQRFNSEGQDKNIEALAN